MRWAGASQLQGQCHEISIFCRCTDKKKKTKCSLYIRKSRREQLLSQMWLTASSYMTQYLSISSYIRKPFLIYDFVTAPIWSSLYMMEIFLFFFISVLKIKTVIFEWPVMVSLFLAVFMWRLSKVKFLSATMKPLTYCENPYKVTLSLNIRELFPSIQKPPVTEWVKFSGKIKKGCVIIPDDNITW